MAKETCISKKKIIEYLNHKGDLQRRLHKRASLIRDKIMSKNVYFRGLIEFSNICANDCSYCGIRVSNKSINRYRMSKEEIVECVDFCKKADYGSIVLQSGELRSRKSVNFIIDIISEIKEKYPSIGITLCVGEQKKKDYERFFSEGAHRYLLRIETSNKTHYEKLHPVNMTFKNRMKCLSYIKEIGYQVGTGVMIGSPYQTVENLAEDILFFKEIDIDMIGMGPYIPDIHQNEYDKIKNLSLSLNMVAATRIALPDVNIASTTALQTLQHQGRELGLQAGANIIMPLVTPAKYRGNYLLYAGKPCINETSSECLDCITKRIRSVDLNPSFGQWGDSKHFFKRTQKC